jgi:hypothetical protein
MSTPSRIWAVFGRREKRGRKKEERAKKKKMMQVTVPRAEERERSWVVKLASLVMHPYSHRQYGYGTWW